MTGNDVKLNDVLEVSYGWNSRWIRQKSSVLFRNKLLILIFIILCFFVQDAKTSLPFDTIPEEINEKELCTGLPEMGTCKSYLHKWYFDKENGNCSMFAWGGCGGNNANRFNSEAECLFTCIGAPHTLPPYLTSTESPATEASPSTRNLFPTPSTPPPLPEEERGVELTFQETGYEKTFMFAQSNTFIQLDGEVIQTFQLRLCREISFQFRTRLPHGLLVYHNVKTPEGLHMDPYALYVIVEKGQLKVVHVFGKHSTSVTVGEGLNRDEWHNVMVRIDVHGARLIASVDSQEEEVYIKGLNAETNYGVFTNLTSVVLVGGLSSEEKLHGVKYIIESFVGCIKDVVLSSGKAASDLLPIKPLIATKHENVQEGCLDRCHTRENLCFVGSWCVNHYNGLTCDCFGTRYEGEQCDIYTATILTLRGSSYVSYRVYDWKDRVHSPVNRISLLFKTRYDDSALFYASGEFIKHQYIAASIRNHSVYIEIDFGDGQIAVELGQAVTSNYWHNLTIFHNYTTIRLSLDDENELINIPGSLNLLYIDPEIYIAGGPELHKKKGLSSNNNFAGSLKYVFYNDISILYELKKSNPKVHYIGVLEPEFYEADVEVIPFTYPFANSHIWWPINITDSLDLKFDFKSTENMAILAFAEISTSSGKGYFEVRMVKEELRFELIPQGNNNVTHVISVKFDSSGTWHAVELSYLNDELTLTVDHKNKQAQMFGMKFTLSDKVVIGSGLKNPNQGLIGCMRDVIVNGQAIEPRYVIKTPRVVGEVALDNCQFVDPCKRPNTCEHGGKCSIKEDRKGTTCDCEGTGYIGKNCHFTMYRKTCEELALLGYTKPDVYLIDIDGNGRFPPAHVKCEFQSDEDATKTIVEHNLPSQVDVRSSMEEDFSYHIKYREFSAEMLQELISHSLYCSQHIKYDCYKAPIDLHSATWFISSSRNNTVDFVGKAKRGSCPCAINKTCEDPSEVCNCDVAREKWLSDEGFYTSPQSLGITEMVFLQQKNLPEDAQGRVTLGPLECVETNTQKYVVTFTTSQSYIEVPGWRKGDIAFSFRTTGEKAILLFQPPIRPNYPSFMVALANDYQLTFNFTLSTGSQKTLEINSNRKLNGGEWHKIWIDYNEYHVRFMINTDYRMVDLESEEQFGPFEGSMFIGGAPADHLKKSTIKQGLIGCFRGLVVNGEILDIYSYMSTHLSEIIKDCRPSCVPSPCKNGAQCRELWSTFQCVCSNPWAHVGPYCETNINTKAITFSTPESYLKKNYISDLNNNEKQLMMNMMQENILINLRTYDDHSLILYANDNFNNFVHLYITNGDTIVYLFNHGSKIVNMTVEYKDLNSGKSVQLAVIRTETETVLHVNDKNVSIPYGPLLLEEYSNQPWVNPELEVLAPHRPPAPPTDYFQINLGGYDTLNLLRANPDVPILSGYVGCIRGLKIGEYLVDLPAKVEENLAKDIPGVFPDCQMKCDLEPCKNGGICTEDFRKQESSCNCEHTSYFGEFCMEEKGADFSGESVLQRKYILENEVDSVKIQLAFSSSDLRQKNTVMLLLQTVNSRSYYLLVALTAEGHLQFEEEREGSTYGAKVTDRNFLNGARHSVYYKRNFNSSVLLIDRAKVHLDVIPEVNFVKPPDEGFNEIQIGGLQTDDPRFATYKSYAGCLSNIFVEVNNYTMKPLEEYMLFTKSGAENITVMNSLGVRSAQCNSQFDVIELPPPGHSLNISLGSGKGWVEDPPSRIPYKSLFPQASEQEDRSQLVFIIVTSLFFFIIICCIIEVLRTNYQHKKRIERETDESIILAKEQATKLHESPALGIKFSGYKAVPTVEDEKKPITNGTLPKIEEKSGSTLDVNGSVNKLDLLKPPEVVVAEVNAAFPEKEKEFLGGIRESQLLDHDLQWDSLGETGDSRGSRRHSVEVESDHSEEDDLGDLPKYTPQHALSANGFARKVTSCPLLAQVDGATISQFPDHPDRGPQRAASSTFLGRFRKRPGSQYLSPVFLNEMHRSFFNPIYYLGGPRIAPRSRNSLESVLSLD